MGAATFVIGHGAQYEDRARELCQGCVVRDECLATALANPDLLGLWGGTTPSQRKAMRRASGGVPARRATVVVHTRRRRDVSEREVELRWAEGEIVDDEDELDRRYGVGGWHE